MVKSSTITSKLIVSFFNINDKITKRKIFILFPLVLIGAFQKNFLVAILASIGIILGAAYMLWLYKRVIFGKLEKKELSTLKDLDTSESFVLLLLVSLILFFGFYPNLIFDTINVSVNHLLINYEQDLIESGVKLK